MKTLFILLITSLFFTSSYAYESKGERSNTIIESTTGSTDAQRLYFKDLRRYTLHNNILPEDLKAMNGEQIKIVGYMIPFDRISNITQFILLQAPFMGCLHVPPPQANETILVTTETPLASYTYDPLMITGKLIIDEVFVDGFLVSVYTIEATDIRPSTAQDAELEDLPPGFHFYGDF